MREQDDFASEVVENLLRFPEQWFLTETRIADDELELASLFSDVLKYEVIPLLHLKHGWERELQELFLVYSGQFLCLEVQPFRCSQQHRFVSESRPHDIGSFEL